MKTQIPMSINPFVAWSPGGMSELAAGRFWSDLGSTSLCGRWRKVEADGLTAHRTIQSMYTAKTAYINYMRAVGCDILRVCQSSIYHVTSRNKEQKESISVLLWVVQRPAKT